MAPFKLKKLIPALGLAVVIVGSVLTYNMLWGIKPDLYTAGICCDSGDLVRRTLLHLCSTSFGLTISIIFCCLMTCGRNMVYRQ